MGTKCTEFFVIMCINNYVYDN